MCIGIRTCCSLHYYGRRRARVLHGNPARRNFEVFTWLIYVNFFYEHMTLCCLNSSRCAPDMSETLRTIVVLYILYRNCGHSFTRFGLSQWPFILVLHLALHAAGDHRASRVMRTAFDKQKESNLMSRLVHCYLYHSCRAQRDDLGGLQSAGHCWMIFDKFCVNEDNVSSIYIYIVFAAEPLKLQIN